MNSDRPNIPLMDQLDQTGIKTICLVPNYQAEKLLSEQLAVLAEQLKHLPLEDGHVVEAIQQLKSFHRYKQTLNDVRCWLERCRPVNIPTDLPRKTLLKFTEELKQFGLTSSEITRVLNQMPNNDAMIELMFHGRFSSEQISLLSLLMRKFISQVDAIEDNPIDLAKLS